MKPTEITRITCETLKNGKYRYTGHNANGDHAVIRDASTRFYAYGCRFERPVIGNLPINGEAKLTNFFGFTDRPDNYRAGTFGDVPAQAIAVK